MTSKHIPFVNALNPTYPKQPNKDDKCTTNNIYQTLPPYNDDSDNPTMFKTNIHGPTSLKHIYTGIPNYYPTQQITKPVGTMYEHDYSQYYKYGSGRGKRMSYHNQVYPFTNRKVREEQVYSNYILPRPNLENDDDNDSYRLHKDTVSLNSLKQIYPKAHNSTNYDRGDDYNGHSHNYDNLKNYHSLIKLEYLPNYRKLTDY